MAKDFWERNNVQFPRLLAEIYAIGLTPAQYKSLVASMDLHQSFIDELLKRAEDEWQRFKLKNCPNPFDDIHH
jgi:hypothetical protein